MENETGKYIWTTKVSNKGQIVIPKEARDVFGISEGDTLLLFGDKEKGIAIAKYNDYLKFAEAIFRAGREDGNKSESEKEAGTEEGSGKGNKEEKKK